MRVLIVEDDDMLAGHLVSVVRSASMLPIRLANGRHALDRLADARRDNQAFDCVILDLGLPGMDGMDVLKALRSRGDATPVIVLTAKAMAELPGLEAGADDFLSKPFEEAVLLARLRAVTRRSGGNTVVARQMIANLALDATTGQFYVDDAILTLTPKAFAILHALFKGKERPVAKEYLMALDDEESTPEVVDTHLSKLRKKLAEAGCRAEIKTLRGVGYMLVPP